VVREGWGQGREMTQALYAHMNNKRKKKKSGPWALAEEKGSYHKATPYFSRFVTCSNFHYFCHKNI
jgi:hypothetical protein